MRSDWGGGGSSLSHHVDPVDVEDHPACYPIGTRGSVLEVAVVLAVNFVQNHFHSVHPAVCHKRGIWQGRISVNATNVVFQSVLCLDFILSGSIMIVRQKVLNF
jgi:hypothetical protein